MTQKEEGRLLSDKMDPTIEWKNKYKIDISEIGLVFLRKVKRLRRALAFIMLLLKAKIVLQSALLTDTNISPMFMDY